MRVLNVVNLNDVIGGQEIYLINIIQYLKKYYKIKIYTKLKVWENTLLYDMKGIELIDINDINYKNFFTIKKVIATNLSKDDIFIFNGNRAIYLGLLLPKSYNKIAIQHSSLFDEQDNNLKKIVRINIYKYVLLKYYKLIGISSHSVKPFEFAKNVEVIFNGVDNKRFMPREKSAEIMNKYKFNKEDKIILMVGRLNENKGQYEALKVFEYLDDSHKMILIGEGEDYSKICDYINDNNLKSNVYLAGNISNVSEFYNVADVLLFMSNHEGLPLTIIEAMSSGIPIVTTNVGGVGEIIEDNKTGLFIERNNYKDIAYKLKFISEDSFLREKLITNGLALVTNQLNWGNHTNKLIKTIEGI